MNTITLKDGTKIETELAIRFTNKMEGAKGLWCVICPVGDTVPTMCVLANKIKKIECY